MSSMLSLSCQICGADGPAHSECSFTMLQSRGYETLVVWWAGHSLAGRLEAAGSDPKGS